MIEKLIEYAQSSRGALISVLVMSPLVLWVGFLLLKMIWDLFKKQKEDDPETAEKKRIAKEELRAQAYLWQEEVAALKEQYGGKIPPEVLQRKLALFNQRHKVMQ